MYTCRYHPVFVSKGLLWDSEEAGGHDALVLECFVDDGSLHFLASDH
jgi:hypothetical protein